MATPDIDALIEQCRTGDGDARYQAILALGRAGDPRAIDAILPSLRDPDVDLRSAAVTALGEIGAARTDEVGAAIELLLLDPDWLVRSEAAEALGTLGYALARPALEQVLRSDPHATPRASAAETLGDLGDRRALEALVLALADDDGPVRSYAALAIGLLGDPAGLTSLRQRLQTESRPGTRKSLLVAATRLGDSRALDELVAMADQADEESVYQFQAAMSDLVAEKTPTIVMARAEELSRRLTALGDDELAARLDALSTIT